MMIFYLMYSQADTVATAVYDTGNNLSPVATTPAINMKLRIFPRIFVKIHRGPDGILRGRDEIDSRKKPEVQNLMSDSL
jgi:hypothetical protein